MELITKIFVVGIIIAVTSIALGLIIVMLIGVPEPIYIYQGN